jgi:hypothetical protein
LEILDATLPQRVQRNNPRVVKKPVSKFKSKKVKHRGTGIKLILLFLISSSLPILK